MRPLPLYKLTGHSSQTHDHAHAQRDNSQRRNAAEPD